MAASGQDQGGQEFSGRTVDEAIAEGLAQLGIRSDQAEVEVLSRGSRGIFGLGSEPARVRISRRAPAASPTPKPAQPPVQSQTPAPQPTPKPEPQAPAKPDSMPTSVASPTPAPASPAATEASRPRVSNLMDDEREEYDGGTATDQVEAVSDEELSVMAVELLTELVRHMGFEAQVNAEWHESDDNGEHYLLLDIHGHELSPLIGRRGETLASIQYLVRLMINQRIKRWKNIVVDVEQYKERRVNQLTQLAKRMAEQVTESGRAVSLEPMPANERRIVHLALRDHPSVYTQSSGEGERRKVHIVARD
ncbi:MAG: Jag N-terminal domain-containing protein [Caldilineaceae bacterium]|nr:Jag N-terminal domain-containing protein [Caldilineaceae bacterium]